eukprot:PhM_4_TR2420/c2_g1_i1/m.22205
MSTSVLVSSSPSLTAFIFGVSQNPLLTMAFLSCCITLAMIQFLRRQSPVIHHVAKITWPTCMEQTETMHWVHGILQSYFESTQIPPEHLLRRCNDVAKSFGPSVRLEFTHIDLGEDVPHTAVVASDYNKETGTLQCDALIEYAGDFSVAAKGEIIIGGYAALPVELRFSEATISMLCRVATTASIDASAMTVHHRGHMSLLECPSFRFNLETKVGARFKIVNSAVVSWIVKRVLLRLCSSIEHPRSLPVEVAQPRPSFLHTLPHHWGEAESHSSSQLSSVQQQQQQQPHYHHSLSGLQHHSHLHHSADSDSMELHHHPARQHHRHHHFHQRSNRSSVMGDETSSAPVGTAAAVPPSFPPPMAARAPVGSYSRFEHMRVRRAAPVLNAAATAAAGGVTAAVAATALTPQGSNHTTPDVRPRADPVTPSPIALDRDSVHS